MNGAALMYRIPGKLQPVFFGGNGFTPGVSKGFGNVYTLTGLLCLVDDDYGTVFPYYTTYFFVNHDAELGLKLGAHRKMVTYYTMFISGGGFITVTPLVVSWDRRSVSRVSHASRTVPP